MRYSLLFLLLACTLSITSEARFFGRGGGWGWRRPIYRLYQPVRNVARACVAIYGGKRYNVPCNSCRGGSCGSQGVSSQQHQTETSVAAVEPPFPAATEGGSAEIVDAAPNSRPVDFSPRNTAALTAPLASEDFVSEPAVVKEPVSKAPTEKERVLAELEQNGWVQDHCTAEYCLLKKDGQEKRLYHDGRVEDGEPTVGGGNLLSSIPKPVEDKKEEEKTEEKPVLKADAGGTFWKARDPKHLQAIIERNRAAGLKTQVIFSASDCGPCQRTKPGISALARSNKNPDTRYYVLEVPSYKTGINLQNYKGENLTGVLGDSISSFPTIRNY